MKYLPENYQPKGQLEGFPLNIIEKMIEEQVAQGNPADVTVFETLGAVNRNSKGFTFIASKRGYQYWSNVIGLRKFDFPDPTEQDKSKPISEDLKQPELPVLRVSIAGEYYVEYEVGSDPKIVQEMMFAIESIGAKRRFDEIAKHMYEAKIQEGLL